MVAIFSPLRTARMVASFNKFSRPAPEKPGVILAVSVSRASPSSCSGWPSLGIRGLFLA